MVRGLYTAASGLQAVEQKMDVIANNLANVDLVGFKKDLTVTKSFPEILIRRIDNNSILKLPIGSVGSYPILGKLGTGVESNESFTSFEQGSLKHTESNFDFALAESGSENNKNSFGFFVLNTPYGERYTRNGNFLLGKEGYLVTKNGYQVLGENGPIKVKLHNFKVDSDGTIWYNSLYDKDNALELTNEVLNDWERTEILDRMKIVHFLDIMEQPAERYLQKQGNSMWKSTEISGSPRILNNYNESRPRILQGFLEASTVNVIREMVNMITANRSYEACQKVVHSHDTATSLCVDRVLRKKG